ncbi:uncharacterized protein LOC122258662 [Penaeus japonicus]|uniref:uncharacterized protein LOC122258662 n=1 Tax=Penaeus japonicus TaxID=27405 RepID=UPI001C70CA6C|nr:uncharacterized protein LOC122258662 [Penaeus japonicus]
MTVHLFGGIWSPAYASYVLHKTLDKDEGQHSAVAKKNFFVDDLLLSTDSEEEAAEYAINLRDTLQAGGFRLTKWMSNSRKVMGVIPTNERSPRIKDINLTIDNLPMDRVLGVLWDLDDDVLKIRVSTPMKPTTHRGILSIMSSIFDPLGLLALFTIRAKMIFQNEVRRKMGWDENPTPKNEQKWRKWMNDLAKLEGFQIPRRIAAAQVSSKLVHAQLHHFCDAIETAYAVVTYIRLEHDNGHVHISLLGARAKLAPIKTTSIP